MLTFLVVFYNNTLKIYGNIRILNRVHESRNFHKDRMNDQREYELDKKIIEINYEFKLS